MKRRIIISLISVLLLSACTSPLYELSQETEVYREYKMIPEEEAFHVFTTAKNQIWEREDMKADRYDVISLTTNDCDVSAIESSGWYSTHIIDCVDKEYLLKGIELDDDNNSFPDVFGVFKDDVKIFESHMFQGAEVNPIIKAQSLDGQLIISFSTIQSYGLFWEGGISSEFQDFEQIRAVYKYNDRIGFLATDPADDMTYLYYDGEKVSPAYDSVRLTTCCAVDSHVYSLYSNGVFVFVGKRDDEHFFTEVDLEVKGY